MFQPPEPKIVNNNLLLEWNGQKAGLDSFYQNWIWAEKDCVTVLALISQEVPAVRNDLRGNASSVGLFQQLLHHGIFFAESPQNHWNQPISSSQLKRKMNVGM